MPKFRLLAFNNPAEGREDEYNEWYTNTHLPDVLRVPGFMTGQRFRLTATQKDGTAQPWKYLALYECEADNVQQLLDELGSRIDTPDLPLSDALSDQRILWCVEPISDLFRRKP